MYYRVCQDCGANLDPQERCSCKATLDRVFEREYSNTYSDMRFREGLPSCIADDIAETAAKKAVFDKGAR